MNKILSPISGWQFFAVVFLVLCFDVLFFQYCMFLQLDVYIPYIYLLLKVLIVIFASYKRILDIYCTKKKTIIITLFFTIPWLLAQFLAKKSLYDNFMDPAQGFTDSLRYFILTFALFLFLIFKKGSNEKNPLNVKNVLKRIAFVVLTLFIIFLNLPYESNSIYPDMRMYDSIEISDSLLMNQKFDSLNRFDVVIANDGKNVYNSPLRIIGLPNEKVEIKDNEIFINGDKINDEYGFYGGKLKPLKINKTVILDDDSYFLMGDNRYFQNGGKYLSENKKTGKEEWVDIKGYENSFPVSKDSIKGKLAAINYIDSSEFFSQKAGFEYDESQKRKKTGIKILFNDETLKSNPSQAAEHMFGKNKER